MDTVATSITLERWLECNVSPPEHITLGLERVYAVAQRLHLCPFPIKSIIVAGTNGKGSTCAMLTLMAQQKALNVGTYTSPHLQRFNERICINGEPVDDSVILEALVQIKFQQSDIQLSYFEYATLAALWIFKQHNVDLAVLEVGLGGRLDAVNIVDADCSVITSIALDHADYLGHDLDAILGEKMGVCRANKPTIIGPEVRQNVAVQQAEICCRVYYVNGHASGYTLSNERAADSTGMLSTQNTWTYQSEDTHWEGLKILPHLPNWQYGNMVCALAAFNQTLPHRAIDSSDLQAALNDFHVQGRLQMIPVGALNVLVDVAHNNQSLTALATHLKQRFNGEAITALFSYLHDKQIEAGLRALSQVIERWILYPIDTIRGEDLSIMSAQLTRIGVNDHHIQLTQTFQEGFECLQNHRSTHAIAFGSFYVVNDVMQYSDSGAL